MQEQLKTHNGLSLTNPDRIMTNKPRIGLVMKSLQADFFKVMQKGALDFAQADGTFELITSGTNSQTEILQQIKLVDYMISQQVDAIVLVPIDSKALVPVVVKAVEAGITVVNIDIKLDQDLLKKSGVSLTYVGPDNEGASKVVGDVLAKAIPPKAKVMIIEGLKVAENAAQRKSGFLRSISENSLNLVASEAADWETDKAEALFRSLFAKHPDIDGVMCSNDAMAEGVIKVLKEAGKSGSIKVVGFDNDPVATQLIQEGSLLATIEAYGAKMAVMGIENAIELLKGAKKQKSVSTKFELVCARKDDLLQKI